MPVNVQTTHTWCSAVAWHGVKSPLRSILTCQCKKFTSQSFHTKHLDFRKLAEKLATCLTKELGTFRVLPN